MLFAALMVLSHRAVHRQRAAFPRDQDLLYLPPPGYLAPMSLGYREALADLIWLRAVIFAGDPERARNVAWVMEYLEGIATLDPEFRRPYTWGSLALIYGGQVRPDRAILDRSIALYRRGLERFPEDHELLFALGMLLINEQQSAEGYTDAEREAARSEGAELIRRAAAFGASPLVRQLAATLVSQGGTDQLAIQFLETQLLQAEDDDHRRLLARKLAAAIGEAGFESLVELREEFERDQAAEFPYLPPDLYTLLREVERRPVPTSSPTSSATSSP